MIRSTGSWSSFLFEHDLFPKTGSHFSGSCSKLPPNDLEGDMFRAHRLAALALLGMAALAGPALAQNFPSRPIRMVIAFPPGGPTDLVGRLLADKMKDSLGQSVIIENKAGANGAIGADMVAKSEPDGHTIFLTTAGAVTITPGMRNNLPYDTLRDFAPITLVVRTT